MTSSSAGPLSRAIALRHSAFIERTATVVIPAGGLVRALGPNARRWAVVVCVTTGGAAFVKWGDPGRQANGIGVVSAPFLRLDAVDYPSVVAQEIWVAGAPGTVVDAVEIVAV